MSKLNARGRKNKQKNSSVKEESKPKRTRGGETRAKALQDLLKSIKNDSPVNQRRKILREMLVILNGVFATNLEVQQAIMKEYGLITNTANDAHDTVVCDYFLKLQEIADVFLDCSYSDQLRFALFASVEEACLVSGKNQSRDTEKLAQQIWTDLENHFPYTLGKVDRESICAYLNGCCKTGKPNWRELNSILESSGVATLGEERMRQEASRMKKERRQELPVEANRYRSNRERRTSKFAEKLRSHSRLKSVGTQAGQDDQNTEKTNVESTPESIVMRRA